MGPTGTGRGLLTPSPRLRLRLIPGPPTVTATPPTATADTMVDTPGDTMAATTAVATTAGKRWIFSLLLHLPPSCSPSNLPSVIYAKQKLYGLTLLTGRVSSVL